VVTVPLILLVGLILWFMYRTGYASGGAVLLCVVFGVLLVDTSVGPAVQHAITSLTQLGAK
jgi:hypothetical protein